MLTVSSRQWELRRGNSAGRVQSCSKEPACHAVQLIDMCSTSDVSNRYTDVFEVGRTSAVDKVESSNSHLRQYLLTYWQPVKHVMKNCRDVLILASTNDQTGSSVQNYLQRTNDLHQHTVQNAVTVVNSAGNESNNHSAMSIHWKCTAAGARRNRCVRHSEQEHPCLVHCQ